MAQDTLLGFPAHTLPYRRGEFITLLAVSRNVSMFLYKCRRILDKREKSNIIVPVLGSTMFCDDRLAVAFLCGGGELSAVRTAVRL